MPELIKNISDKTISSGIYTIQEAALYSRISSKTLHRWFVGNQDGNHIIKINDELSSYKFIGFLDFIQVLAIRAIRQAYNIPLNRIREGIEKAQSDYSIEYPFARKHITMTDGKEIYIYEKDDLINLTGKKSGQYNLRKIVELYLEDLCYDENGYANRWTPITGIVLRPELRFGEPIVESCGITAYTLYEAAQVEGSIESVAEIFEVNEEEVKLAYKYFDSLKSAA